MTGSFNIKTNKNINADKLKRHFNLSVMQALEVMKIKENMRIFHPSKRFSNQPLYNPVVLFKRLSILPENCSDIVHEIKRGMDVAIVDTLSKELGISQKKLLHCIMLSPATFKRRCTNKKRLTTCESDRIYRIVMVYRSALELFNGNIEAARRWLIQPAKSLGGIAPFDYLDNAAGADEVYDLIARIEHGIIQ